MMMYLLKAKCFVAGLLFFLGSYSLIAQVGINTNDPKSTLDVNGALSLRLGGAFPSLQASTDYLDPAELNGGVVYSLYGVGSISDFDISGIKPVDDADGQFLVLVNDTPYRMSLKHDNCETENYGFWIQGEKNLNLTGKYSNVFLLYSKNIKGGRWVIINKNNHIEVWESEKIDLVGRSNGNDGITICKVYVPQASPQSTASVNIRGSIDSTLANNLYIEYVETRQDTVAFRVRNTGSLQEKKKFNVVINKI